MSELSAIPPDERMTRVKLMAHMVAFFPDRTTSVEVAMGLADGGAHYLEIQFPFSDPSADGGLIQTAGSAALRAGFTVAKGFELVHDIAGKTQLPVFIMSYANLVFRLGSAEFVKEALQAGAKGLIVPDLTPGNDEGLYQAGRELGADIVPVVAPSVSDSRLDRIAKEGPRYLYAALRLGITGDYTQLGEENLVFLKRLSGVRAKIIAGFGIRSHEQVRLLEPHVHALVVGSAFVQTVLDGITGDGLGELRARLEAQVQSLVRGGVPG